MLRKEHSLISLLNAQQSTIQKELSDNFPQYDDADLGNISTNLTFALFLAKVIDELLLLNSVNHYSLKACFEEHSATVSSFLKKYAEAQSIFDFTLLIDEERQLLLKDIFIKDLFKELYNFDLSSGPELIGFVYEHFALQTNAKQNGIFYTPANVVKDIVELALKPMLRNLSPEELSSLKILDPACGAGVFLLEAYRALLESTAEISLSAEARKKIITESLYGVDRDRLACELSRATLQLAWIDTRQLSLFEQDNFINLEDNIVNGNSLVDLSDFDPQDPRDMALAEELEAFSWYRSFSTVMERGGFDCIIGNPPYGLARDDQLSEKENKKLKQIYKSYRYGKINKYLSFIARGYELLNPRGKLAFVVPNAWLGIKSALPIRKKLLEDQSLAEIIVYTEAVFETANVEATLFLADKARSYSKVKLTKRILPQSDDSSSAFIPVSTCKNNPDCTIPVHWSEKINSLMQSIAAKSYLLGDASSPVQPFIALQAYAQGKGEPPQSSDIVKAHSYHFDRKINEDCYPYLEGANVQRYLISWSGKYLHYGPWLAEAQKLERFKGPRILLREVISPPPYMLTACFVSDTLLYNKSVLHLLPKERANEDLLLAITAIFNSKLASFLLYYRGRKTQRKIFPKILNDDLRYFYLPLELATYSQRLSQLAKTISNLCNASLNSKQSLSRKVWNQKQLLSSSTFNDIYTLQTKIDEAVYHAYGLGRNEIEIVEDFCRQDLV